MHIRLSVDCDLSLGVNVSLNDYVVKCASGLPVQGDPCLPARVIWDGLQLTRDPREDKDNGWTDTLGNSYQCHEVLKPFFFQYAGVIQ